MSDFEVYSLIEGAAKSGIWIRDIREQSGLTEPIIRRVLKGLEQKKLVKAIKAVGTQKKSYILFNVDADENLTGGTFYSDQQFDSQFVQTLVQFCVRMLQVSYIFLEFPFLLSFLHCSQSNKKQPKTFQMICVYNSKHRQSVPIMLLSTYTTKVSAKCNCQLET